MCSDVHLPALLSAARVNRARPPSSGAGFDFRPQKSAKKKVSTSQTKSNLQNHLVPHDLAAEADLLDTRADLRQPFTGRPVRLSRRDVRVACTQVCFVGRGWWPSVYDGPVPALCQTVEMTLCAFCSVDTAVPIVATLAVYFTGAWGLTSSCCTSHSLLEHTMDRGRAQRRPPPGVARIG